MAVLDVHVCEERQLMMMTPLVIVMGVVEMLPFVLLLPVLAMLLVAGGRVVRYIVLVATLLRKGHGQPGQRCSHRANAILRRGRSKASQAKSKLTSAAESRD